MNQFELLLVAGLAAIASGASLFGLYWILRQKRRPQNRPEAAKQAEPLPYRRVEALLTPSERALFRVLRPIAESAGADVFAKVRLDDVVQVRKGAKDFEAHRSQIAACGIDFLLCDREKLAPLLALQVEGIARERGARGERERALLQALDAVGIAFFKIPAQATYDIEELGALIHEQLAHAKGKPDAASGSREEATPVAEPAATAIAGEQASQPAPDAPVPYWLDEMPASPAGLAGTDPAAMPDGTPLDAAEPEADDGPDPAPDGAPSPAAALSGSIEQGAWPPSMGDEGAPALAEGPAALDEVPALQPAPEPGASDPAPRTGDPSPEPALTGLCPACGHPLVPMQDVETGEIVIACSRYPECGYIAPASP